MTPARPGAGGRRPPLPARRQDGHGNYDAFLSYSRADQPLADRLHRELEGFARPWNRARSLRVYRDVASLAPNADLWTALERGLAKASWLIVVVSPAAATSAGVQQEIAWWLEHRSIERIVLVRGGGSQPCWDGTVGDFAGADWLPPALRGQFPREPLVVDAAAIGPEDDDLAVSDVAASLYAAIRDIPKDEAFAEAVREHRRRMRVARGAVVALLALLALALAAGALALRQRDTARRQETLAVSRQLAALSGSLLRTDLDVSLQLAVEAVHRDRNPQTEAALLAAALASPHLVRYYGFTSPVTCIAGSSNGEVIVAGLADGRIMRWRRNGAPAAVARLRRGVKQVAVDAAGSTIVATDGDVLAAHAEALLVRVGHRPRLLPVDAGQSPSAVGVSPTGRTVLVVGDPPVSGAPETIFVLDGRTGAVTGRHDATDTQMTDFIVPSDAEVVLYDAAYGGWDRRAISTWDPIDKGGVAFGAHQGSGEPAANGEYMTATNGDPEIPVWALRGAPVNDRPTLTAFAPIRSPGSLALSPDGRQLAVADTGVTYVARTRTPGTQRREPLALDGVGNVDAVRFLGPTRLLTASGTMIALWDLRQPDRLARRSTVHVGSACSACGGASIAVSGDGRKALVVGGSSDDAALVDLATGQEQQLHGDFLEYSFTNPVWDGSTPVLPVTPLGGGSEVDVPSVGGGVRSWRAGEGSDGVIAVAAVGHGRILVINDRGKVFVQDAKDGSFVHTATPFPQLEVGDETIKGAAIDPRSGAVAVLYGDRITVIDGPSGRILERVRAREVSNIVYGGSRLFVQGSDGTVRILRMPDLRLERTLAGDPSYVWPPVPNPQGTMVARQRRDSSIVLVDVDSGATLTTIPPRSDTSWRKTGVAFSPDSRQLITLTDEARYQAGAELLQRDLSEASLVRSACRASGPTLAPSRWRLFIGASPAPGRACQSTDAAASAANRGRDRTGRVMAG